MMVAISGIDGSGKTSVATEVVKKLNEAGYAAVYSRPKYKVCKQFEYHLYHSTGEGTSFDKDPESALYVSGLMIDWLTHSTDFLQRNGHKVIVLDRYVLDVLAQCIHFNGPSEHFEWFKSMMPDIDIGFFLHVEPEVAFERLTNRAIDLRKFETRRQLAILQQIYGRLMPTSPKYIEIDNNSLSHSSDLIVRQVVSLYDTNQASSLRLSAARPLAPMCPCCDGYMYP